ncbi:putative ABC transporter-binding protein precursor [Prochlorococcus marinus str. MIT 1342]|uniref:ABC transporter substrate-binding protein n=1 Tax=Prochlorococcus TaxID=1218 RepID=UPI0007B3CA2B|nr:ABC transporter substrate-binding protein [Prochlorococcus marinus]KZR81283.1 putative ABC transporter-binding protein precursor [Prochlorococcus marinus str. MIT 1342]
MKRRIFTKIALLFSLSSVALFASWALSTRPIQINILMPAPFAESTTDLVQQFNKDHHGMIQLRVTRGPLETEAVSDLAISSLLLGKSPFDALLIDVTWLPKYAAAGWLIPLDPWIDQQKIDSIAPGAMLGNNFDGKLYRWPLVADMGLLYWRTDLMSKPPRTPEELIKVSLKLQKEGRVANGYVWQGRQYEGLSCVFLEVLDGFGGQWLEPETDNVGLDSSASLKAASWLRELILGGASPKAVINYAENEALQAFKSGDVALMRNWPYAWGELQKPNSDVRGNVGVTTMVASAGNRSTSTLGSWGFSILKGSSNPQAAAEAIAFLTSTSAQKILFLNESYTPTKVELFKDQELLSKSQILPELAKALESTDERPSTPLYAQISDVLQRNLSSILTGQSSVSDAMANAQANTEKILMAARETK